MAEDKINESDTAVFKRVAPGLVWMPRAFRDRLTPGAVWGFLGALALVVSVVVSAQHDIHELKGTVRDQASELKKAYGVMNSHIDVLNRIDKKVGELGTKVDNIAAEVGSQRAWRERIESVAETPIHVRKR